MAITNTSIAAPGVGVTALTGTFATDAAAALSTTVNNAYPANQGNISVASSAGLAGRYVTWPGGGAGGADGIIAILASFTGTTAALQNPGLQTGTAAGVTITRWEQLMAAGQIRAFTVTAANGDKWAWAAGAPPYELKYTPNGGSQTTLTNAVIVVPEQIHFAPGILPVSTTFTIAATING